MLGCDTDAVNTHAAVVGCRVVGTERLPSVVLCRSCSGGVAVIPCQSSLLTDDRQLTTNKRRQFCTIMREVLRIVHGRCDRNGVMKLNWYCTVTCTHTVAAQGGSVKEVPATSHVVMTVT